jgi:hypothetical protein
MKKGLHPAAIAAAVAVLVVAIGAFYLKFGSSDVKGVSMADAMKTTHGNTVNTITGEPLTETQKQAAARQEAMISAMQHTGGGDPSKSGSYPHMGARTD